MEVMEKPRVKTRKKSEKSKRNKEADKEVCKEQGIVQCEQEEPIASSSTDVDVTKWLEIAANDIIDDGKGTDVVDSGVKDDAQSDKVEEADVSEEDVACQPEKTDTNGSLEIISPSVPQFPEAPRVEYKYIELQNQLKLLPKEELLKPEILIPEKMSIKSFSEQQLSALYTNTELHVLSQFTDEFVEAELKGCALKKHPLYDLLLSYLRGRSKLKSNGLELRQARLDCEELQMQLWTESSSIVSAQGRCLDGTIVRATHTFTKATFHRSTFQRLIQMLEKVMELSGDTHSLHSYSAEVLKLQIDLYVNNIMNTLVGITQLSVDAPIYLGMQPPPQHLLPYICDLRLCISVLFQFQRKLIRDTEFVKETREWLSQLVFLLLRLANWQDHLFILNHVLRCPAGIGTWASNFIQTPLHPNQDSPFANFEINHVVSTLALILMPVNKRNEFLEELSQKDEVMESLWVIVDSDGEEDDEVSGPTLRENDLVALLNQLPLDDLFRAVLLINKKEDKDIYNESKVSEHHILRFFAFSTSFLKILQTGLKTYNQLKYQQFSKRLSRLIRHLVQFATDQWELFQKKSDIPDDAMMKRLQTEYDAFFLRAIYNLYISEKLGAWQFLAVVPYGNVSYKALWKIFYFLHELSASANAKLELNDDTVNCEDSIWDASLRETFDDKLKLLAEDECYYLLNTFANMALARKDDEMEFIHTATMDLLWIGFVSESTQERCSKDARILLTHITSKYPHLLSDILKAVKEEMSKIGSLCLYLYEELPITVWKLTDVDVETIENWLLQNPITADESKLARMILSRLNWTLVQEGTLFLPYRVHCRIACLIAKAVAIDPGYAHWAWQTAFRLRLHINDKGFTNFQTVKDMEYFTVILNGVREQQPLASFLSILISSWGHLIPMVCTKGFDQLLFLQTYQKHEAVLFALNLIVPLFIECQESIINSDKFQNILLGLLNADRTYINIAKSLVTTQSTILEQFGNMIDSQIANYTWYNLDSPRYLVRLWINSLVSIVNWQRDYGVMYLLDVIIRASFFYSDTMEVIFGIMKDLLQCATPQESSSSIGSLFKWVSQSGNQQNLLINTSLSTCQYLAFVMLNLEFEEREKSTGLWVEVLAQLKNQKGKSNVDLAIKKAASKLKVSSFSSGSLCIFRWAQQALDAPLDHPILVLLWQKFFSLYLYRIPTVFQSEKGCLGDKFFEGMINFNFLKRLKKRLNETVDYYKSQTIDADFQHLSASEQLFYMSSLRVFTAYCLWLEEPRCQESNLYLSGLPPQYEPQLLNLILQCSETSWLEYVNYNAMKDHQEKCIRTWRVANYREKKNINQPLINPGNRGESADPWERIVARLKSYDSPKKAPPLKLKESIIPPLNLSDKPTMFVSLEGFFKTFAQFARNNALNISDHKTLNRLYQELVPQLYRSVVKKITKNISCSGTGGNDCVGAAAIILNMEEAKIFDPVNSAIQDNRRDYEGFLGMSLRPPSQSLCYASVILQNVISILQKQKQMQPETSELGVELFYHILTLMNEDSMNYLPTKKLFTECLERLGQSHINGIEFETPRLLNKILEDPLHGMYLAPHFSPTTAGPANFLLMYAMISEGNGQKYDLLYSLLSKFDVNIWLTTRNPKQSQRSQFIEMIMKALIHLGQQPPEESLMLHEVYRKHLICVFLYQFPEHYGEIFMHILKASNGVDQDCIALSVWLDILNCLSKPIKLEIGIQMRDQLKQYAHNQQILAYQELLGTAVMLSRHFTTERFQYGLYGLYPKTRNYIDALALFFGMTGHSLIISALNTHQGILGDKLCEIIWPHIRDMFAPWIVPYCTNNIKDNMANWIQQLTDDRSVILPWIPANAPFAQKMVHMFFECVVFIVQTLPACNILSHVWHWYVTNFAHPTVKDHVLNVIHHSFLSLPWQKFWPSLSDLELMVKVAELYLPDCHVLLGQIFMEVPWRSWLITVYENPNIQVKSRVHFCLLNLLVKLCNEPNVRKNCAQKAKSLLVQAEHFDWALLDAASVHKAMDWYVMSCDPAVLFKSDPMDIDFRAIQLLRTVCFYDKPLTQPDALIQEKRHVFIRSFVKLIVVYTSRHKNSMAAKEQILVNTIKSELNNLEQLVTVQEEMNINLGEILTLLNQPIITNPMLNYLDEWIVTRDGDSMAIKAVLQVVGSYVADTEALAFIYESCIATYFNNVGNIENVSWKEISKYFNFTTPKQNSVIDSFISKGSLLSLHIVLRQKIETAQDFQPLLSLALQWLENIKILETFETKVPLIWADFMDICLACPISVESKTAACLHRFAQLLLQISEQKEAHKWGGILGAIGIGKQSAVTLQFRFLCRAMAGYILAQLPDRKGQSQTVRNVTNSPGPVGQPGGNVEVAKILLKLDFGQNQGKIKMCAELALKQIQDPQNSLHNVKEFLSSLVSQLYTNIYLKDIS